MNFFTLFDFNIALLYFLGSMLFLGGTLGHNFLLKRVSLGLTIGGFFLHSIDLIFKISNNPLFAFAQGQFYFSLLAWSFLLIYIFLWWRLQLQFLALTAAPLALILFTSSMVVNTTELSIPAQLNGLWFGLHIAALFLSIAFLAMAFGSGVCYLYIDKQIKHKAKINRLRKDFPSLSSFDRVNHWAVSIGFPLFTVGVLAGFIWARFTWGKIYSGDPKELVSLIIWFIFAYLFHQRMAVGWKGRKPAHLATWLFALSIGSLLIINFYLPTHHSFQP